MINTISTLGQGAQGIVNEIVLEGQRYALKVYNNELPHSVAAQRRSRKIGKIISKPETGALSRAMMVDNGYDSEDNPVVLYKLFKHRPIEDYFSGFTRIEHIKVRERLVVGLTAGVVEIHRKGIIHADLAPINVLYSSNGAVAIIDFDGAGLVPENGKEKPLDPIVHGHQDFPGWVTPFETINMNVTRKTDIWWLGSLIMKVLTGYNPFFFLKIADEEKLKELFELIGDTRIEWPPQYNKIAKHSSFQPKLSAKKVDVVRKVLNHTIATARLGDIFRNYYHPEKRPVASHIWCDFRSRVFR